MAHLFVPQPTLIALPVFFNVDGVVGAPPAQNKREDVLLVQFAFTVIANSPNPKTDPKVLEAAKAVKLTGVADPATIAAIRTLQEASKKQSSGKVVDGRVSPAKVGYSYGGGTWTIANLNNSMQGRNINIWPRIDKIPGCPGELKSMVIRTVAGI